MTDKTKRFCEEYLIDLNATKAAERSGFSKKTAYSQGQRLLKKAEIQKAIQRLMDEQSKRTNITQDRVLNELAMIGFSDLKNYLDIDENTGSIRAKAFEEMPRGESRVLKTIREDRVIKEDSKGGQVTVYDKIKFELHDKIKALELIGRHLGMFIEDIRHSGEIKTDSKLTLEIVHTDGAGTK